MVLIVDDNQENVFSLKTLLNLHKFDVDTANSGEEALKKILKNTYSLIILDVQMPDMDGFEVAEAVSGYSKSKDIPIIFLSAVNIHKKFITKGYASGGIDYVTKPFDPDILLLKIKTFYRLAEQTRRLQEMDRELRDEIEFRKRAESRLKDNVAELESILESIPQVAFTTDFDGNVEFVNQNWYQFSLERDEFPQCEEGDMCQYVKSAIRAQHQQVHEIKVKKLGLEAFRFYVLYLTPVQHHGIASKWVGILTDIHEQKIAAQLLEKRVQERTTELVRTNQKLEESNYELQQFAFIASHDLQEPLRKIQVFSNLLNEKYTPPSPQAQGYLEKINLSAERLRKLIADVLDYSNIKGETSFSIVDLNGVVERLLTDLEVVIKAKGASITAGPLPTLEVIPVQIRQVFQNLISNALKFARKDVPCRIEITAEYIADKAIDAPAVPDGDYCRIAVQDNGIGFSEDYAEKIFEIFQRLNTSERYEGTGIGLAIVKKVVDRHHGLIAARSIESLGTCFIMVFPVRQTTPVEALQQFTI
jgi:signal transduction histidine kinase/FixJ family two-component response regulator